MGTDETNIAGGALQGIKVVDFSRVLAGPWASMTLGDLGADVIKIEPPEGDDTRAWGPPFRDGLSAYFACANRNKRSFVLDLKSAEAPGIVATLARWADVVIENYRTGVADRLGIGYQALRAINPRIIYASISGYGRDGPEAQTAGYDFVIQAEAGLMSITGEPDGEPIKVAVAVADLFTGQNAVIGILAALQARARTGTGQQIDVSLFDSQIQMLSNIGSNYLFTGAPAFRYGNTHASIVPYQTFASSDGHLAVAVASPRLWQHFCTLIDRPQWIADPRFASNPQRVQHRDALVGELAAVFATRSTATWLELLEAAEIPCAPVNSVGAAIEHPVAHARGMRIEIDGVPMLGSPIHLSDTPVRYRRAPPALDHDRASILCELGLAGTASGPAHDP